MYPTIIFLPFFVALLATIIITPISLYFIKKFNIVDDPKSHKHPGIIHKKPIPRAGSIAFYGGIFIAGILFVPATKITIAIAVASAIALLIGILDDKLDISPYLRFLGNFLVAVIVVGSGAGVPFVTNPLGGILQLNSFTLPIIFFGTHTVIILSDIIALLWIMWVMNMLNWSKGVDGQMPGIVAISALVIGILSLRFSLTEQNTVIAATLSFAIAGSALGFLLFNFYPARIFPGYGTTAVYLVLSVVSILSGAKLATAILVMGVPMVDGLFTIGRRILTGHSPFWHDNKHLHHLLLKLGLGQRRIALFYWCISAILGLLSLTLSSQGKLFALIMLVTIVGGGLLFLHFITQKNEDQSL